MFKDSNVIRMICGRLDISKIYLRLVFALGGDKTAKECVELLFYLIDICNKAWDRDYMNMIKHDGWFLQCSSQMEHNIFMTPTIRRKVMEILEEKKLIEVTRKGSINGTYKIRILEDNIEELIKSKEDEFRKYNQDYRDEVKGKKELNRIKYENKKERFEKLNNLRYVSSEQLLEEGQKLGFRPYELWLVSVISKGLWKYQKKKITWKEVDFNNICFHICGSSKNGNKDEQEKNFYYRVPTQSVIDACKTPSSKYKWMKSWSLNYCSVYCEIDLNKYDRSIEQLSKFEDKDYYFSDITNEVNN